MLIGLMKVLFNIRAFALRVPQSRSRDFLSNALFENITQDPTLLAGERLSVFGIGWPLTDHDDSFHQGNQPFDQGMKCTDERLSARLPSPAYYFSSR
jgi:hypothetical protein